MKSLKNLFNKITGNSAITTYENSSDYTRFVEYYAPAYDSVLQSVVAEYKESRNI